MRLTQLLPIALAGAIAAPALAQQVDLQVLRELDEVRLLAPDGTEIGEIEEVLLDDTGRPVAFGVEIDDGFLDLDEEGRVFLIDELIWQNGNYVTGLTAAAIEGLPDYND